VPSLRPTSSDEAVVILYDASTPSIFTSDSQQNTSFKLGQHMARAAAAHSSLPVGTLQASERMANASVRATRDSEIVWSIAGREIFDLIISKAIENMTAFDVYRHAAEAAESKSLLALSQANGALEQPGTPSTSSTGLEVLAAAYSTAAVAGLHPASAEAPRRWRAAAARRGPRALWELGRLHELGL